jgi:hypothetical protein
MKKENEIDHIQRAVDILEMCLGYDHPETGEAYSVLGLAYVENGDFV